MLLAQGFVSDGSHRAPRPPGPRRAAWPGVWSARVPASLHNKFDPQGGPRPIELPAHAQALRGTFNAGSYVAVSAPVPEPETWLLLLAGAGIVGFTARKRQQPAIGRS